MPRREPRRAACTAQAAEKLDVTKTAVLMVPMARLL
jgi:hypothetical protein